MMLDKLKPFLAVIFLQFGNAGLVITQKMKSNMSKEWFLGVYATSKPYIFIVFLQISYAVNCLIVKAALNKGLNHYTYAVYRNAAAALFFSPFAFFFERPVINQNLYFAGMKFTTATFAGAMCNILPAITFVMAWIFRLEKVKIKSLHSQVKIIGTLVTIGGAMIMTLIRGPSIQFPWTNPHALHQQSSTSTATTQDQIKGSIMIMSGSLSWASFIILQAVTLKAYPVKLSLTALVCMMGALEGSIVTLVAEKANASVWSIHWDIKLLAALYSGIVCSGCGYYILGLVMQERGPVFATAFNPLALVIIAILASSILAEKSNLGSVLGAVVIVVGLYLVIWGKSKDQKHQDHESSLNQQHNNGTNTLILKHDVNSSKKASSDLEVV